MRVLIPDVFPGDPPETAWQRANPPEPGSWRAIAIAASGGSRMTVAEVDALAALWKEVDAYFASHASRPLFSLLPPDRWLAVSVDVSSVIERLQQWDDPAFGDLSLAYPFGAVMQVDFSIPGALEPTSSVGTMPERFIDQFWLAMNLASPGSLDLSEARTLVPEDNDDLPKLNGFGWADIAEKAFIEGCNRKTM